MNSRIEIVSDTEVRVRANGAEPVLFAIGSDGALYEGPFDSCAKSRRWDAEGRAALRDAINCLEACGDFGGLHDTDPRPYVGKVFMFHSYRVVVVSTTGSVIMKYMDSNQCWTLDPNVHKITSLTPLPRQPAIRCVRPFEPWEAAKHLGRKTGIPTKSGDNRQSHQWEMCGVTQTHALLGKPHALEVRLDCFAKHWTWADDGSPCGVTELKDQP